MCIRDSDDDDDDGLYVHYQSLRNIRCQTLTKNGESLIWPHRAAPDVYDTVFESSRGVLQQRPGPGFGGVPWAAARDYENRDFPYKC